MIAAGLLGVIAAAVVMVLGFAQREAGSARLRTISATNARESLDRVHYAIQVAAHHNHNDTSLCDLLTSAGGPMDAAAPASSAGACPNLTVSGIPIPQTTLRRTVALQDLGGTPRMFGVTVTVTGAPQPAVISTQIVR